jgi:hypothetical protein
LVTTQNFLTQQEEDIFAINTMCADIGVQTTLGAYLQAC